MFLFFAKNQRQHGKPKENLKNRPRDLGNPRIVVSISYYVNERQPRKRPRMTRKQSWPQQGMLQKEELRKLQDENKRMKDSKDQYDRQIRDLEAQLIRLHETES